MLLLPLVWLVGCEEDNALVSSTQTPQSIAAELAVETPTSTTAAPTSTSQPSATSTALVAPIKPTLVPAQPTLTRPSAPYPEPEATEILEPYPIQTETPTAVPPTPQTLATIDPYPEQFLPIVSDIVPSATPLPTATPLPSPTPIPTLDFEAVRESLNQNGVDLSYNKIGFHVGPGGNRDGLGEYMRRLDEAGVPIFLKSVGDAGPLFEAQELSKRSGVPHVLVYRFAGNEYDTPNYDLPPVESARQHWDLSLQRWPPELDPSMVWLETLNEVDKERSEWLGEYALETARLAERDGYKWAAFGWSSGEPEVSHWTGPKMLEFLRLAGENPDRLAIALHEYSFLPDTITDLYPYKVGRFQFLFEVVDQRGIPRPTVLMTEWGWAYRDVPPPDLALEHLTWANRLYAPYPQIKGGAIWYLGPEFGNVADQTQKLIEPVTMYSLTTHFEQPLAPNQAPIEPERYR